MTEFNSFPIRRLRRFREKKFIRKILQENTLNVNDLIYPIFVSEDISENQAIQSMPEFIDTLLKQYYMKLKNALN